MEEKQAGGGEEQSRAVILGLRVEVMRNYCLCWGALCSNVQGSIKNPPALMGLYTGVGLVPRVLGGC